MAALNGQVTDGEAALRKACSELAGAHDTAAEQAAARALKDAGFGTYEVGVDLEQIDENRQQVALRVAVNPRSSAAHSHYGHTLEKQATAPFSPEARQLLKALRANRQAVADLNRQLAEVHRKLSSIPALERKARAKLAEIERRLGSAPELEAARARAAATATLSEETQRALRRAEGEAGRQQEHLRESERRLYSGEVRNPKELKDLAEEVASLKRFLSVLEERQLEAMLACDQAEKNLAAATTAAAESQSTRDGQVEALSAEKSSLRENVDRLEAEREAALAAVPAEDLALYASLRQTHRGVAVVRLEGGACRGCGVTPSNARIEAARSGEEVTRCGNCGRILYAG
jgi:predicted  nucleic acid-binding Zn-ribbon protein